MRLLSIEILVLKVWLIAKIAIAIVGRKEFFFDDAKTISNEINNFRITEQIISFLSLLFIRNFSRS